MSFAPFTSMNHHLQSILFGVALLEDETMGTFVWLFWGCMFDKPSIAIITDQDAAICNAVSLVFPESRPSYWMWMIGNTSSSICKDIPHVTLTATCIPQMGEGGV